MNCILSLKSSIKVYKRLAHDESSIHPKSSMKWKPNSMTRCTIAFNFLSLSLKAKLCWLTYIHDVDGLTVLNLLQRFQPWNGLSFCIFYSIHLHHLHWLPNNWQWLKTDITIDLVWTCLCLIGWRGKWYVRIPYIKQTFKEWLKIFFASNQSLFGSQLCGLLTHLISKVQKNEWKLIFNSLSLKLTPISYEISFLTL